MIIATASNINHEYLKIGFQNSESFRPLGYERVYLPLHKVADTPFHIQGDD